jgi:hypothetical protein
MHLCNIPEEGMWLLDVTCSIKYPFFSPSWI